LSLELKIANENDAAEWDRIVGASAHSTIFHTWKWLKIVEKQTRTRLYPIMAYRGTTIKGIYPIFLKKKGFIKLAYSPPPNAYLFYLGPVIPGYESLKQDKKESTLIQLQEDVDRFLFSGLGCKYVRIRSSPGLPDFRPFKWRGYGVEPMHTYRINLRGGAEHVWEQFDRKLRVDINRTAREKVKVEEGSMEDLEFIYSSFYRRLKELGWHTSDYNGYLVELYKEFHPDNMKIFIANYKEERVGGVILLCYKDTMRLWMGTIKSNLKGLSPNDLAQWESIKWACSHGFNYYENIDNGCDPRLRPFKSKYNPELAIWFSLDKYSSNLYSIVKKSSNVFYNMFKKQKKSCQRTCSD